MTVPAVPAWPDERADPRILETIDALFLAGVGAEIAVDAVYADTDFRTEPHS